MAFPTLTSNSTSKENLNTKLKCTVCDEDTDTAKARIHLEVPRSKVCSNLNPNTELEMLAKNDLPQDDQSNSDCSIRVSKLCSVVKKKTSLPIKNAHGSTNVVSTESSETGILL